MPNPFRANLNLFLALNIHLHRVPPNIASTDGQQGEHSCVELLLNSKLFEKSQTKICDVERPGRAWVLHVSELLK